MAEVVPFLALNSINQQQLSCDEQDSIALVLSMVNRLQSLPVEYRKTAMDILTMLRHVQPDIRNDFLDVWCGGTGRKADIRT